MFVQATHKPQKKLRLYRQLTSHTGSYVYTGNSQATKEVSLYRQLTSHTGSYVYTGNSQATKEAKFIQATHKP